MNAPAKLVRASLQETEEYFLQADRRNPKPKKLVWLVASACLLAVALNVNDLRRDFARAKPLWWLPPAVMVSFCVFMLLWLGPFGHQRRLRKAIRGMVAKPPVEAHFEFSEAGFLSTGKQGQTSFHPWPTVPEALIYIYSDGFAPIIEATMNIYFWVPRRAFQSDADYEEVLAWVAAKVKKVEQRKGQ